MVESHRKILVRIEAEVADLVPRFLANMRLAIERGYRALDARDFEQLRIIGHDAKGTGGGYGFDAITTIGAELESSARDEDVEAIRRSLDELGAYLSNVQIEIDRQ